MLDCLRGSSSFTCQMSSLMIQSFPVAALFFCLVIFSEFHFSASKSSGFSFTLIPRDSPGSPLNPGNLTRFERIQRLAKFSHARANYVTSLSTTTRNATLNPDNFFLGLIRDHWFYIAEVEIGIPATQVYLMVDTGGDQIWTQCLPCKNCFPQKYALYDSEASSSYRKLPCYHPFCSGDKPLYQCVNEECVYTSSYLSGSVTSGVASLESFKFRDFEGGPDFIAPSIIFGCSNDNRDFKFSERGMISGIMGFSLSPDSLVAQLADHINRRFSYCMSPYSEGIPYPLNLRFGEDIPPPPGNVQTTPFHLAPPVYWYMLNLLDISVNLNRMNFPPGTFQRASGGSTLGLFIDSGAPITLIDQRSNLVNAYLGLMLSLQIHYDSLRLERTVHSSGLEGNFEYCYKDRPDFQQHPTITYHFEGADYTVDSKFTIIHFDGYFCVSILPGNGVSILGAYHQQNMRIIHDGNINSIQFYPENCADDHTIGEDMFN
ncbi:hypothetical protein Q3G72_027199 [Acer saccharum]|nr:hypothetical protein Q3G72_027199 [Acer saccharum]